MVTLLPGFCDGIAGTAQETGDSSPRYAPPCFLTPPRFGVPNRVLLSGVNLGVNELCWDPVIDEGLSKWSTDVLGHDLVVSIHSDELGNALVIDTNASNHMFAVGPRLELLDKYFGCGQWLLGLARRCPLHVWTPEYISDYAESFEHLVEGVTDMYPEWARFSINPHRLGVIPDMPKNLRKIVDACLAVDYGKYDRFCAFDNAMEYPFAMLSWYGNIPDFNKRTKKLNPYVAAWEERGSNKLWMLADLLADHALQSSMGMTCHDVFHSVDEYKECITDTVPFMRLLNYLSHDQLKDGFSLHF